MCCKGQGTWKHLKLNLHNTFPLKELQSENQEKKPDAAMKLIKSV